MNINSTSSSSTSSKKTVLVTGGAGFIGSHLCERLVVDGHKVISLDNYFTGSKGNHVAGVDYREGHTKDIETLIPETPDLIYHLGEYSRVEQSFNDIAKMWDLNKTGTFAVLEFARRRGSKIVYAGSSTKFGDGGLSRDQSPYAWAKATNTELVKNYSNWFGIPYAITYFYNVYGPRERYGEYGTLIEIFRQNTLHGRPLAVVAPGTQRRNFTNVKDIINGLILVGEKGEGDDFGLGDDRSYSVLEIAQRFGGEIVMLPEREGNRMGSEVHTEKSKALGWGVKHSVLDYIDEAKVKAGSVESAGKRVLVLSTTFHPIEGPAEKALCELMQTMPDLQFDVVTTHYHKDAHKAVCPATNATVYRVGFGNPFDKFLLPILGALKVGELSQKNKYLFVWSIMASYATAAALLSRHTSKAPLLVTLADQKLKWYTRIFLRLVLRGADQVHASNTDQQQKISSLTERMEATKSLGAGDAFANQIRFAYTSLLAKTTSK